jgi:hypothetical protein
VLLDSLAVAQARRVALEQVGVLEAGPLECRRASIAAATSVQERAVAQVT